MKRILFLTTHFGSGYEALYETLDANPLLQGAQINFSIKHPSSFMSYFSSLKHKDDTSLATYVVPFLVNHMLLHKEVINYSNFVYLVRPPFHAMHEMVDTGDFTPTSALNYYLFRLRRISQLAAMTPGAVFLTWDNIFKKEGLQLIEDYLELPHSLKFSDYSPPKISGDIHNSFIKKAQSIYDKYHKYMLGLNLKKVEQ